MNISVPPFTVLTVNTHKGFTALNRRFVLHELRDAVRAVSADVVFLQEVVGRHTRYAEKHPEWPDGTQVEFLADSLWTQYAYGRNAVYPEGDHGNGLMSKFPIVRYRNLDVSVHGPERRGLLHGVLQPPGWEGQIHVVCVHLGLQESHRRVQLDLLCELVQEQVPADAPLVVAGDFNDWRLRAHAVLHRRLDLRDPFVERDGAPPKTFPARWPLLRLDRIYVRNLEAVRPVVLSTRPWSHLSDHAPLAVELHPMSARQAAGSAAHSIIDATGEARA
ncbi:MAG TPA: endonuclease/exonuclease/phosphatase family protein [Burkholderiaceae bacterium]|nr:endonuclease/exonuclease/phosphatase family protein [Burkholderiaceae bacterium]